MSLQQQEDHNHRQHGKDHRGAQLVERGAILANKAVDAHLDRLHAGIGAVGTGHHQRPEQRVVAAQEGIEGHGDQGRAHQRHADGPEIVATAAAIAPRGIVEFLGQAEKRLAQQKDAKGAGAPGHDLHLIGVEPAQAVGNHVVGNDHHDSRHDQAGEDQAGEQTLAREAHRGQAEAGQRGGTEHQQRGADGDECRIEEIVGPGRAVPGRGIVAEIPQRPEAGRKIKDMAVRDQGGQQHPVEGEGQDHTDRHQQRVAQQRGAPGPPGEESGTLCCDRVAGVASTGPYW